jgi:membrane-associated phospholipid phosphatase
MDAIYQFGIQLTQALQALSLALDAPMSFFSFLGSIDFYLIFITFIYWVVDSQLGMRLLLVLISTDFFGDAFKQLLHQPRPYWVGEVKALATETSYGIPSTHSSDSLSVWGTLAYNLRKDWLWAVSGLVVVLIALSRLYLGVHFPQDVLGGWLIGVAVIYLFVRLEPKVLPWLTSLSALAQIGIGFVLSLLMILIGLVIGVLIASSPDPAEWSGFSIMARSPAKSFTLGGAFFGAVAGYVLMLRYARFRSGGPPAQQAGRYFLGIAGVLVLYLGLDMLFGLLAIDESAAGYLLRYIRYASVTLWATFGAPWFFLKLNLAKPAEKKIKVTVPA